MRRGPQEGAGFGVSMASASGAWGDDLPEWIVMLAQMADKSSQTAVGRDIGYSGSVVSAVLKRSYNGDLNAVEKAVRGRFMREVVACPVLGEIGSHICLEHQKRAVTFSSGSSLRVAIARACKGACPHSRIGRKS